MNPTEQREGQTARQTAFLETPGCVPESITVGPFGLNEDWLRATLQIEATQLHVWHGDELGAPRDYVYRGRRFFYTAEGVRRILALLGLEKICAVVERTVPPPPATPRTPDHSARKGGH